MQSSIIERIVPRIREEISNFELILTDNWFLRLKFNSINVLILIKSNLIANFLISWNGFPFSLVVLIQKENKTYLLPSFDYVVYFY